MVLKNNIIVWLYYLVYERVFTRSVHQPLVYAFDAPTTAFASLHQPPVYKALTNQGGGASVYRPRSLL